MKQQRVKLLPLVLIISICASILLLNGCAEKRAILVVKGSPEEKGGVQGECKLGEYCGRITDGLCSKDLNEIIDLADLDTFQSEELYNLICSGDYDAQTVEKYCSSLPEETRQRLYRAFEQYGYYINGYG